MKEARELLLHQTSKESTLRAATKEEVEEAWQRLSMQAELPGRVRE
jgi:hypothetical protein